MCGRPAILPTELHPQPKDLLKFTLNHLFVALSFCRRLCILKRGEIKADLFFFSDAGVGTQQAKLVSY